MSIKINRLEEGHNSYPLVCRRPAETSCDIYVDVIVERMSEVRKGTSRNTKNENKRHQIFNMALHVNWDCVLKVVKKNKKENKNKQTKREKN